MKTHAVQWSMPAPLWGRAAARGRFSEPALLRFATDDFMDTLADRLQEGPEGLEDVRVVPERYGTLRPEEDDPDEPVTLYQPVQQRYYMVATSLTCREQGLPDRTVDVVGEETASFVLRRLVPTSTEPVDPNNPNTYVECGWFKDRWKPVLRSERLQTPLLDRPGEMEERLPLFRQTYTPDSALKTLRRPRSVWVGLVPVARRQEFESADTATPGEAGGIDLFPSDGGNGLSDPRLTFFTSRVIVALQELTSQKVLTSTATQWRDLRAPVFFALYDFYSFIRTHLSPSVRTWIDTPNRSTSGLNPLQGKLQSGFNLSMKARQESEQVAATWADALRVVGSYYDQVESGDTPDFDEVLKGGNPQTGDPKLEDWETAVTNLDVEGNSSRALKPVVKEQFRVSKPSDADLSGDLVPPVRSAVGGDGGVYVVRCVYERPRCEPYHPPTVSAPSRPFRMASYFDKEAPARPVRVELPGSVSIQDFRDAPKGVALIFSQELRNQVERVQNLTFKKLDDGEIDDGGGFGIGMICMLSLPIITIVGLILLLLMVNLLNIVFWWLPFFKICFPVPKRTD